MKRIVDTVRSGSAGSRDLSRDLSQISQAYNEHVVYVKLPDGSFVFSYDIEEETLSDGSKVYNIILNAE